MATNNRSALLSAHMEKSKQSELRPILTSLNGDNSWLMAFPVPASKSRTDPKPQKAYYHIVWDPWFATSGAAVTFASWLASVSQTAQSTVNSGDDVERIAREIESKAAEAGLVKGVGGEENLMVDAIIVSFYYTDHMHEASLRKFDRRIPVIAAPEAAAIMEGWDYFQTIVTMKDMGDEGSNWQALHPSGPLPAWLTPFRLKGEHELNFATVLVWSHRGVNGGNVAGAAPTTTHEALWVAPHGIRMDQPALQAFLRDTTKTVDVLAMLHPLKESFTWGWQNVYGVMGGLAIDRALKDKGPKYWVPAADAVLGYWGLIMLRVWDIRRTLDWGLAEEEGLAGERGRWWSRGSPTS
ncbi:hypothetical protein PG997_007180 [Apiospora hydei]|uniref:Uncharacterized protein n=1 Tax=Apiospora hydei TaxID=1337664 RepID=A0ABR1W7H2_9PEZI